MSDGGETSDGDGAGVVVVDEKYQEADGEEDAELAAELAALSAELQKGRAHKPSIEPWLEKYRPSRLCDIAHQSQIVRTLERTVELRSLPNMLFYGPPGTGKTTAALALARQLYGNDPTVIRHNVLELNASTERGIDVIRAKVKAFARFTPKQTTKTSNVVGFKVVILDEADAMTREAQGALRRLMETSSGVTRFFILCNYISRIIEPILSRCALHRFQPVPPVSISPRLRFIAASERLNISPATLEIIAVNAAGDLRRAISALHQLSIGNAGLPHGTHGTLVKEVLGIVPHRTLVEEVMGIVPDAFVRRLLQTLLHDEKKEEKKDGSVATAPVENKSRATALAQEVVWEAYCPKRLLETLVVVLSESQEQDVAFVPRIMLMIGEAEERLQAGTTLHQLADLFARIMDLVQPAKFGRKLG